MKKSRFFLIMGFCVLSLNIVAVEETISKKQSHVSILGTRTPKTVSEKKVQKIEDLIYGYVNNGSDIKNEKVKTAIISDVRGLYPVSNNTVPINVNVPEIKKDVDVSTAAAFPLTEQTLTEKYTKESEEIFKPVPINSNITVRYRQGPYNKAITGRYFGLTYYNDGIRIENSVVPLFDLSDIDKSKFDEKLRLLKRKEYISSKIGDYTEQKNSFAEKAVKEKVENIVKKNEQNGFIFIWNRWLSPENVANVIIMHLIEDINKKPVEPSILESEKKKLRK